MCIYKNMPPYDVVIPVQIKLLEHEWKAVECMKIALLILLAVMIASTLICYAAVVVAARFEEEEDRVQ